LIAWFAETFSEAPGQAHDAAHEELLALVKARIGLVNLKSRLQNQSEHAATGLVRKPHARLLKALTAEIAKLEAAISAKIKATPHLAERAEIESVPRPSAAQGGARLAPALRPADRRSTQHSCSTFSRVIFARPGRVSRRGNAESSLFEN
jgi:transposase